MISIITFYKFVALSDCADWQPVLLDYCLHQNLRGTILLATEGINGTIAGTPESVEAVLAYLRSDPRLTDLSARQSTAEQMPFDRMKVKLKREIVTLGIPVDPSQQVGTYVEPQDWNALISDPDVVVIDTRNQYEVEIGSFKGAQNPGTHSFREFPDYVRQLDPARHPKVAMFCTGGIRCEKASSYLLSQGFHQVYHLKGGILSYLEQVPAAESLWEGECFVFDQRVALQQGLEQGSHEMCLSCGHPISEADQASSAYEAGISCPHCIAELTPEKRQRQVMKVQQSRAAQQINA
ncbi:MAG: rhodanese-related sulfurtransferase [Elainella sp.]